MANNEPTSASQADDAVSHARICRRAGTRGISEGYAPFSLAQRTATLFTKARCHHHSSQKITRKIFEWPNHQIMISVIQILQ
jgi:hypothetical protein